MKKFVGALLPIVATIISFILFIITYLIVNINGGGQYFLISSMFIIPFIIFATISFLYLKEKINAWVGNILTLILIPIMAVFLLSSFLMIFIPIAASL